MASNAENVSIWWRHHVFVTNSFRLSMLKNICLRVKFVNIWRIDPETWISLFWLFVTFRLQQLKMAPGRPCAPNCHCLYPFFDHFLQPKIWNWPWRAHIVQFFHNNMIIFIVKITIPHKHPHNYYVFLVFFLCLNLYCFKIVARGHLDELQKAEKYPIRWSL